MRLAKVQLWFTQQGVLDKHGLVLPNEIITTAVRFWVTRMVDQPITQKVVPSAAMYVGSTSAMFGGFTANELAALGGSALAVLGFVANFWFKWQH